jgi:hypothetical protein
MFLFYRGEVIKEFSTQEGYFKCFVEKYKTSGCANKNNIPDKIKRNISNFYLFYYAQVLKYKVTAEKNESFFMISTKSAALNPG